MPGLTDVELIERAQDAVTIRTNEGVMRRSDIAVQRHPDTVEEFAATDSSVLHTSVMSDVEAPGVLGFLYGRFGSRRPETPAFLSATRTHLERL